MKKFSLQFGFDSRFLNRASQEIRVKLNVSRLLKFYQVKQLNENSIENSAEKNFKEDSQFNEFWNSLIKQNKTKKQKKRKEKYSNPENFLSWTLSQISSSKLRLHLRTLYLFYLFLSCFLRIQFHLKTLLPVLSFWISIRTRKLLN